MMNSTEVNQLVKLIIAVCGKTNYVAGEDAIYWVDSHFNTLRRIVGASMTFVDPEHGDDVDEPVAFLEGGGYLALYNCELESFKQMVPVSLER